MTTRFNRLWSDLCATNRLGKLVGKLSPRCPAVAKVVQQIGGFGWIDAARTQIDKNLGVGMTGVEQPPGKIHIRRQNLVNHI